MLEIRLSILFIFDIYSYVVEWVLLLFLKFLNNIIELVSGRFGIFLKS